MGGVFSPPSSHVVLATYLHSACSLSYLTSDPKVLLTMVFNTDCLVCYVLVLVLYVYDPLCLKTTRQNVLMELQNVQTSCRSQANLCF